MYSIKELRDKLANKILELGIDSKFQENPAFDAAIDEIDNLISQMNMFEAEEKIIVSKTQESISFRWNSPTGGKYSLNISSATPETFKCIKIEEREPFVGTNGKTIKSKNVVEKIATIDKSSGFFTLITNGSMIDNANFDVGKCNNSTWAEKKYYTSYGVMITREYKRFPTGELTEDFDKATVDSMLYTSRQAFDSGFWNNNYETRTLLTRDKLDTATIVSEDKKRGIRYIAITPLSQEYGLRDMILLNGYDSYPQDIVISPLSLEKIEEMLKKEKDPKVAEGLRNYAVGRENYYYNSADDKNFVCEGISQSQGKSK